MGEVSSCYYAVPAHAHSQQHNELEITDYNRNGSLLCIFAHLFFFFALPGTRQWET